MFKHLDGRIIIGGVIIAVLIIGGIYVYSQWSFNRFADEIGESPPPQMTIVDKNKLATSEIKNKTKIVDTNSTVLNQSSKKRIENIPIEEKQISEENSDTSTSTTEFDTTQLLSAFGVPEEITTLLDEETQDGEHELAEEQLKEKYGNSPAVDAIIEDLKAMSGRPVGLSEITSLFEAWIQVLPEEEQKTRRQLMNSITQLNQIKELGSDNVPTIITIEVGETEDTDK